MAAPTTIPGDLFVVGNFRYGGTLTPATPRSSFEQEALVSCPIPFHSWRVFDAIHTNLPGTSASDDLALIGGTHGSASPSLQTYDVKAAGAVSLKARTQLILPPEYDPGQDIKLRFRAGMLTTIADVSATLDALVFKSDSEAGVDGADLVATAATTINSLTLDDIDFIVTATALSPGDVLDLLITIAVNDAATGTTVKGIISAAAMLMDLKG